MAGRASVVLRLRTKEGHSRIEVSAAASLEDVVTKISQHLQVPRQALHLYLDQRYSQVSSWATSGVDGGQRRKNGSPFCFILSHTPPMVEKSAPVFFQENASLFVGAAFTTI